MDDKEHEAYIKRFKAYTTKLLRSKEDAMAFLQSTGIYVYIGQNGPGVSP